MARSAPKTKTRDPFRYRGFFQIVSIVLDRFSHDAVRPAVAQEGHSCYLLVAHTNGRGLHLTAIRKRIRIKMSNQSQSRLLFPELFPNPALFRQL
jgi:hypothetical protein